MASSHATPKPRRGKAHTSSTTKIDQQQRAAETWQRPRQYCSRQFLILDTARREPVPTQTPPLPNCTVPRTNHRRLASAAYAGGAPNAQRFHLNSEHSDPPYLTDILPKRSHQGYGLASRIKQTDEVQKKIHPLEQTTIQTAFETIQ